MQFGAASCWIVDGYFSWPWWRRVGEVSHSRSGSRTALSSAQCRIRFSRRQAAVLLHKYTFTYISCCNCIFTGSLEVFYFSSGNQTLPHILSEVTHLTRSRKAALGKVRPEEKKPPLIKKPKTSLWFSRRWRPIREERTRSCQSRQRWCTLKASGKPHFCCRC